MFPVDTLLYIIGFSLISGVGSVLLAYLLFRFSVEGRQGLMTHMVHFAIGTLLGAALINMLPEVLEKFSPQKAGLSLLAGLLLFFWLEKLVIWHHHHENPAEATGESGVLIVVGDGFHNFIDGLIVAAAFLHSHAMGVATALAVTAHEIPQELADMVILMENGYSRRKALWLNALSGLMSLGGAFGGFWAFSQLEKSLPFIMALSTASFLYIALADLIPAHRHHLSAREIGQQFLGIAAGMASIVVLNTLFHAH